MAVRPSKEELLESVSPEKLDQCCEDSDLAVLSLSITDWQFRAPFLGLTEAEEQVIKQDTTTIERKRLAVLRKWKEKHGHRATYRQLVEAFWQCQQTDLAHKTCEILRCGSLVASSVTQNGSTPRQQTPHDQPSPTLDSSLQMFGQQIPSHSSNSASPSSLPTPAPSLPLPSEHAATSRIPHDCSSTGGSASHSISHQTLPHPPTSHTQTAASPNSLAHERYCHPGDIGRPTFPQHHSYQMPLAPIHRQQSPLHSQQGSQRKHKQSPTLDSSLQMSGQQMLSHASDSPPSPFLSFPAPSLPLLSEHASNSPLSSSFPFPAPNLSSQTPLVSSHHHVLRTNASFRQPYQMHSSASDSSLAVYSQQRHQAEFGLFPPSSLPYPAPSLPLPGEHVAAAASPHDCSSTCTTGSVSQSVPHQTLPHPPMAQTAASPNSLSHERYRHPGDIGRPTFPQHHSYHTLDTRTFPPSPYYGQRFHQIAVHPVPPCMTVFPQQRHQAAITPPISQGLSVSGDQPTTTTDQSTHSHTNSECFALQPPPSLVHQHHTFPGAEALHPPQYQTPISSHSSNHDPSADRLQLGNEAQVPNAPNVPYLLPLPNRSHVIQQYAVYLRQRYGTHIPSFFTLTFPPPTRKVFNLSMTREEEIIRYPNEELTRLMLHGNVRGILHRKKEVKLEEICIPDEESRRVILIEGAPGAGKSTLALHIVQKWRLGEMFQEFGIVIYVKLRDPAIQAVQSLADILPARSKAMAMEVASALEACDGRRTLFVIDGWDEYPPGLKEDSLFKALICEPATLSMHLSTLIITSRPIATGALQQSASTRVEIVGFTQHEAKQYFTEALGDSQSAERLQECLRERPVIEASCSLPLIAAIVVHLFKSLNRTLPTTLHGVLTSMVICCIIRHMKRQGSQQLPAPHEDSSLEEFVSLLPNDYQQQFLNICALAYHGMIENKATLSRRDLQRFKLPVDLSTLSLIQVTENMGCYQQSETFYNFLHLSIQELLAAFHISKMPPSEQVEIFEKIFGQPRFAAVFQFYAAFTKLQTKGVQEIVATIVMGGDGHQLLSLLHCLYEAQDSSLCKFVASKLNGKLNLAGIISNYKLSLSPVDCLTVGYFLSEVCLTTSGEFCIALFDGSLDDYKVSLLVKGLSMQCHRTMDVQTIDTEASGYLEMELWGNDIEYEGAHSIAELLSSSNGISKLDLSWNPIQKGGNGLIDLFKALMTNTSLIKLMLGYEGSCTPVHNPWTITESYGPVLSEMLKVNRTLKVLCLARDVCVSDMGAFHIAEGLKCNTGLEELDLSWCKITSKGAEFLVDALTVNKQLRVLDLSWNNFGDSGVTHIANALKVNSTLKELHLACCSWIEDEEENEEESEDDENGVVLVNGIESLASALTVNQQLELLDLSHNPLEDSDICHISDALKTNTSLKQLYLHGCEVSEKGAETLASALAVNATLETLNLSVNPISDFGFSQLVEPLEHKHTLKELDVSDCGVTDRGMKSLASILKVNTSLKTLDLSQNNFTDSGLKALGESLRHNRGLERLELPDLCQVTVEGLKEFVLSLQENSHLRKVIVGRTGGGPEAVTEETAIVNQMRRRKGLPELEVSDY